MCACTAPWRRCGMKCPLFWSERRCAGGALQQGHAVTTIVGVILVRAALCRRCMQQGDAVTTIDGVIFSFAKP